MKAIISSRSDLRSWVEVNVTADPAAAGAATEYLNSRSDRPDWGSDWSQWLAVEQELAERFVAAVM